MSPSPRGPLINYNLEANPLCGLGEALGHNAPCGDVPAVSPPTISWSMNSTQNIVFVKNEDHFFSSAPGSFAVNFVLSGSVIRLATVTDTATGWNYYYSVPVSVPAFSGIGYLQVIYSTNNPAVKNTNFYSCADIQLQ